ncbi:MAG: helix-turn-helix domain-containing protein [Leptospirales bacterium]
MSEIYWIFTEGNRRKNWHRRSYIGRVEKGTFPSSEFLMKVTLTFNVSVDWLLLGRGTMYLLEEDHFLNQLDSDQRGLLEPYQCFARGEEGKFYWDLFEYS